MGGKWTIFRRMGEQAVDKVLDTLKKSDDIDQQFYNRQKKTTTQHLYFIGNYDRNNFFDMGKEEKFIDSLEV